MAQVSKYLRKSSQGYIHYCPGCEEAHAYRVGVPDRPAWTFNGDVERPSFTPSMLIRSGNKIPGYEQRYKFGSVCHYFLTDGQLQFLADSTHALAGKTLPLPELPDFMQGGKYGDGNP